MNSLTTDKTDGSKEPCIFEGCNSSDGLQPYVQTKAPYRRYFYCFVCKRTTLNPSYKLKDGLQMVTVSLEGNGRISSGEYLSIRGLSVETLEKFGVRTNPDTEEVFFDYYTYDTKELGAEKRRTKDKNFRFDYMNNKTFRDLSLFGANLFSGGKYITVTEGEFDAMSAFEMNGSSFPVVSVKNGATSKFTQEDINYLEGFERVYVCFDADDPGKLGAEHLAQSLSKNKAYIVKLDPKLGKDANDYLQKKLFKEFNSAWWAAKPYAPDDLVFGSDTFSLIQDTEEASSIPYPWEGLNDLLHGARKGELVVVTAGSGLGKTEIVRELALNVRKTTNEKIGLIFLEESLKRSVETLVGMELGKNLRLPENQKTSFEEKQKAWESLFKDNEERIVFWKHFGSNTIEKVVSTIRYMAVNFGAKFIVLDHISIIVSGQQLTGGDERRTFDLIMTELRTLVQELDISLFLVSHLKRPDGTPHEEGAATSLAQLRGSGAIGHLADIVIGLERNGQELDPWVRNVTTIRVLKNRFTGETGPACKVVWHRDTGRLEEVTRENEEEIKQSFYRKINYVVDDKNEKDDL